jgi:hypothetical protein
MKRLVLAALVLSLAGGAAASARSVVPSSGAEAAVHTGRAVGASGCPWLAAHAASFGERSSPPARSCPARSAVAGSCPASRGDDRVDACPRGRGSAPSARPALRAASGGVV